MLITKTSEVSGVTRSLEMPVTAEQIKAWQDGELIHLAMPHLTADQREFILTGIVQDEWDEIFKDAEE